MGFSPALDRLWDWPDGSPVQAQFLHGRGRLCRPAVWRGEVLRVSGCMCSPAQVCCEVFLLSWFCRWGPACGPELHGWPAGGPCLPRLAASRLACLHAAGLTFATGRGSLVSACLQPGLGLSECPWTADMVAVLLARRGAVAGGGHWAVFMCVTGSERSPASTPPAPSKFGAAEVRASFSSPTWSSWVGGPASLWPRGLPQCLPVDLACPRTQGQS